MIEKGTAVRRSGFGFAIVLIAAIAFSGCTELRSAKRNLVGQDGETYYALATLRLHAKPSPSSKVTGHLALHEKVTRIRFESGYALVAVGGGGLEGWVENAKLARRIPAAGPAPEAAARKPASAPITDSAEPLSTAAPTE